MTPEQKAEIETLSDSVGENILNAENLMNQFEPGSEKYNLFSACKSKLKEVLSELESINP